MSKGQYVSQKLPLRDPELEASQPGACPPAVSPGAASPRPPHHPCLRRALRVCVWFGTDSEPEQERPSPVLYAISGDGKFYPHHSVARKHPRPLCSLIYLLTAESPCLEGFLAHSKSQGVSVGYLVLSWMTLMTTAVKSYSLFCAKHPANSFTCISSFSIRVLGGESHLLLSL